MSIPPWVVPIVVSLLQLVIKYLSGHHPASAMHALDEATSTMTKAANGGATSPGRQKKNKSTQKDDDNNG